MYSFSREIACLNAASYIHLFPCTDKLLRTLRSVTWRAGRRSPRGTGAIIQVSPDPPISRACWWIYSVPYQALESSGVWHMHGATPGRDQLSRYTSEAKKLCGLEKIRIRRPCKKAIPWDMKKSLPVEHSQFYPHNKNQQNAAFTFNLFQ